MSRAVRAPSRSAVDRTVTPFYADASILAGGPPSGFYIPLTLSGNDEIKSEKLIAYELGYRTHLTKALSLDTAAFVNDYSQLISISQQFNLNNNLGGEVYGGEINAVWEPAPTLRVEAGYSYAKSFLKGDLSEDVEESYPENHVATTHVNSSKAQQEFVMPAAEEMDLDSALESEEKKILIEKT